jgi:hypothetical protein
MKKLLIFLMILILGTGTLLQTALAEGTAQITVRFGDPGCATVFTWDFPYSDEWFLQPESRFNREMAQGSIGLTVCAYQPLKKQKDLEPQYDVYLSGAGFEGIYTFGYDTSSEPDTFAGIIARKKIGDYTVIAVAGRGSGYSKEWGGNLKLGDGKEHAGFRAAADILEAELEKYLTENAVKGPVVLWTAGYSRSAAVGNLAAADWTASGKFDRVYAYFFACPRVTEDPVKTGNIFNVCGAQDFVTQIPMQSYGFERNGTDVFLPSEETVSDYGRMKNTASETAQRLTGLRMSNNPEFNLMNRLGISLLGDIFQEREEYANLLQNNLLAGIPAGDVAEVTEMLPNLIISALGVSLPEDRKPYILSMTQLGTLATLMITLGKDELIRTGAWDTGTDLFVNIAREHLVSSYISWIFSALTDEEILHEAALGRILFLDGCRSLTVYRNGEIQWTLEDGITRKETEEADGFVGRFSSVTAVMLPTDGDWQLTAGTEEGTLRALEIMLSPDQTFCESCVCYLNDSARENAYELTIQGAGRLTEQSGGDLIRNAEMTCDAKDIVALLTRGFTAESVQKIFAGAFGENSGTSLP